MKRFCLICGISILLVGLWFLGLALAPQTVSAAQVEQQQGNIPRGGALFDRWTAVLGVQPPAGNMPIWSRQVTNTRSGADTWRCVSCHGWDYQGKDGAYRSGSFFTGFPGLLDASQKLSISEIVAQLKGARDPGHDFSKYLNEQNLTDLATFIKAGVIDDNKFIDKVTIKIIGGDESHGKQLYDKSCASCHGADGATLKFKFEGLSNATLGTLAALDPWRFLHKTRFGTPGTPMTIGFDLGWQPQDGRDVLLYTQTFPTGLEKATSQPVSPVDTSPANPKGGPAQDWLSGLLTVLGAMTASFGFAILLGVFLVGIIFLVVWVIRGSKTPDGKE